MALDMSDPRSPAEQVAHRLRQAIAEGRYKPNEQLPTGEQLAAEYGVARGTVMRALYILRSEKLVQSWQGKGTFVRQAAQHLDVSADAEPASADGGRALAALRVQVAELKDDIQELRNAFGLMQAQLMHLYQSVGQPYPHEMGESTDVAGRPERAAHG